MPQKNFFSYALRLLALWIILPFGASAQSDAISISGRVLDQNSAAISGATVTLQSSYSSTQRSVITDENGWFRFEALLPAQYRLVTHQAGFSTSDTVITAKENGNTTIEVLLHPAAIAESVVITSSHLLATPESMERKIGRAHV